MDTCENCGQPIGKLETPFVFEESVVCKACHRRLSDNAMPTESLKDLPEIDFDLNSTGAIAPPSVQMKNKSKTVIPGIGRVCPACGSTAPAIKKPKGSRVLLIFLLLLWLLPGIVYLIVYSGYVYTCPRCGYKFGDAA